MKKSREHHRTEERETISGELTPADWDDPEGGIGVMLSSIDGELYLIENGAKFIDLIHQHIEASGIVKRNRKSFRTINIKKFRLIDSPSDGDAENGWLPRA